MDYVIASEAVVGAFATLNIVAGVHGSDHRPVHFTWRGKFAKLNPDNAPVEKTSRTTSLMGWRFIGNPSAEQKKRVAVLLRNGQAAAEVLSILREHGPDLAFSKIEAVIRDVWETVGITIATTDGSSREGGIFNMPVAHWYDDEVKVAHKRWHAARRKLRGVGTNSMMQRRFCKHARRTFEKQREESKRRWRTDWERYWCDVSRCDHTNAWRIVSALEGKKDTGRCECSAEYQRAHYEHLGKSNPNEEFDWERAQEAEEWVADFVAPGRGKSNNEGFVSGRPKARKKPVEQ